MMLSYPLLFPHGESGWHEEQISNINLPSNARNTIIQKMWHRYVTVCISVKLNRQR